MSDIRFEEKILYKCHQHWIIPTVNSLKLIITLALPAGILTYFLASYSWIWTSAVFLLVAVIVVVYDHYLWHNSWLMIGNQKITLSVRNGLFSQYAMNIRYRNIRDSAVSKHSIWGYLLKYGTIFVRSSANEGDFHAHFIPKV
jgi:membrane protein YdbS with pleckstrin-like domain